MYELTRRDEIVPAREFDALTDAMAAAGHADMTDWQIATGLPDEIHTDWKPEYRHGVDGDGFDSDDTPAYLLRYWVIRSPGVAHELIDLLPDETRSAGTWSTRDSEIATAVMAVLPKLEACPFDAGMLIAAHYAAAGEIDCTRIGTTISRAYNHDEYRLPASEVVAAVFAVAEALTLRQVPVTGYPPVMVAGLPGAGKSPVLRAMLEPGTRPLAAQLPADVAVTLEDPDAEVWIIDGKTGMWPCAPRRRWWTRLAAAWRRHGTEVIQSPPDRIR